MSIDVLIWYLKQELEKAGTQKAFARQCGISEQYLTDILKRRREPGEKLLKALKIKRVITYERY